jgi:beta-glucosidase
MFPDNFVWGTATSAYQVEGAAAEDGRKPSIWDTFTHTPGVIEDGSTGTVACDHYHRYREDIALMRSLGITGYRFSVAWPRVLPDGTGAVNQAGLDFYDRLVDELLAAGITPFVTLYHWDLPQALHDRGGWAVRETAHAFVEYARVVAERLSDRAPYWMTHNEPWVAALMGYYMGIFAPGQRSLEIALQVAHHILLSHGLAVPVIREAGGTHVGIAPNLAPVVPASHDPADQGAARFIDGNLNRWFLDPLAGKGYPEDMWAAYGDAVPTVEPGDLDIIATPIDFLGVNYYSRVLVAHDPDGDPPHVRIFTDPDCPHTADREIYPEGLYETLARVHQEYDFPVIYITENGAAFPDQVAADGGVHDADRIAFLEAHFAQAARAIEAGVPLKGYFIWSFMDNFEWSRGYDLRYGITYVDYATQQRILKDSALWYRDFIAAQR